MTGRRRTFQGEQGAAPVTVGHIGYIDFAGDSIDGCLARFEGYKGGYPWFRLLQAADKEHPAGFLFVWDPSNLREAPR